MPVLKLAVREGPAIWSLLFGNVSWGGLLACRVAALVVIRVDRSQQSFSHWELCRLNSA